jgi:cysteine-rich repeat protein
MSEGPSISADGRYVAFSSESNNLVAGDTLFGMDVFVRDRTMGTTTRASVSNGGAQSDCASAEAEASISADGRYVAFHHCGSNLTPDAGSGSPGKVFVRDLVGMTTVLVSKHTDGTPGNNSSVNPSISSDGRYVAFASYASNLVDDDTNGKADFFLRDTVGNTTVRVDVSTAGAQADFAGNLDTTDVSISGAGSRVVFSSKAVNLTHGDSNASTDVFVWADCAALAPTCGDGTRTIGCEACDDGNLTSGDGCDANCTITGCSNGIVTAGEGCDDGNATSGDGCSFRCNLEQPLDADSRACVNTVNKDAVGVAKIQAKLAQACLKAAAGGTEPDAQACLTADPALKLMKAEDKTTSAAAVRCNPAPAFGFTSASSANTAAENGQLDLIADLFGANLTAAAIDATSDPAGAKCQAKVLKAAQKLSATQSKLFLKCKKVGMADAIDPILSGADLETCFQIVRDDDVLLPKMAAKLLDALTDDCAGVVLTTAFPGACTSPLAGIMSHCLTTHATCHFSQMFNAVDGVSDQSDLTDDCIINGSCS